MFRMKSYIMLFVIAVFAAANVCAHEPAAQDLDQAREYLAQIKSQLDQRKKPVL